MLLAHLYQFLVFQLVQAEMQIELVLTYQSEILYQKVKEEV
jgi:hypothetical protein